MTTEKDNHKGIFILNYKFDFLTINFELIIK